MADQFSQLLNNALQREALLRVVLSSRRASASVEYAKVIIRPVQVRGKRLWQFAMRRDGKETHENLGAAEACRRIEEWFQTSYCDCQLLTSEADYRVHRRAGGVVRIRRQPPTRTYGPTGRHDRRKAYLIPEGRPCPFLVETGVMTASGKVRAAKYHKFRQINRFLELVDDVVPSLGQERPLRVVDFGCGKSYLTFALHHLLTEIHRREVNLTGLDRDEEVIDTCRRIAQRVPCPGLTFEVGEIAGYTGISAEGRVDLVVSLHACDTATDDSLAQAVRWGTKVILAVPCCQHELAAAMVGRRVGGIGRHGILKERFAALATDALRADILEEHGYKTQVLEFIDLEHTAKNVLIRAVRRESSHASGARGAAIEQLKTLLGVTTIRLERLLRE